MIVSNTISPISNPDVLPEKQKLSLFAYTSVAVFTAARIIMQNIKCLSLSRFIRLVNLTI